MTILCGTDFTPAAAEAVRVASLWCRATREELVLAHALGDAAPGLRAKLEEQLAHESRLLVEQGVGSRCALGTTPIDTEIVRLAQESKATLVVLGALGRRAAGAWRIGSTADRVAQACRRPLLVVRAAQALEPWLAGGPALKVAVACEASATADAALRWAAGLARVGKIELLALHSYGIHEQREKRGVRGPLPIGTVDPRLEQPLAAELQAHIGGLALGREVELVLRGGLGRPADQLADMAAEAGAGLVVVGNHHKRMLERAWKGSVSRGLIELAKCSVACVSVGE
jgi:nucleotide-binding universal stress UspA family protein